MGRIPAMEVNMWDKLKAAFLHSVTILWARVVALTGLALAFVPTLVSDPNVSMIAQTLLKPKFIPFYLIAIGIVTELCRWRTATNAPATD
jgi:hypothetical protein